MADVVIIGAGPAGMTAAVYARRSGLDALMLESAVYGGQIVNTAEVENYPAFSHISGWELAQNLYEQATGLGAQLAFDKVSGIEKTGDGFTVIGQADRYPAKSVIIANGAKRRKLGCPGEEEFTGRGVSYCATCDGAFFKDKTVAVIGGGNTAVEDAIYLSRLCKQVYLVHRRDGFRAQQFLQDALLEKENIELKLCRTPVAINGDEKVTSLSLISTLDAAVTEDLAVDAVFVAVGLEPDNGAFASLIALDEHGYILAGEDCRTSCAGVFAAGDTRTKHLRQIVTAASDGAAAATAAAAYVL